MIPVPWLSRLSLNFYRWRPLCVLRSAVNSVTQKDKAIQIIPSSWTIPIEVVQKREHFIVSRSLLRAVDRRSISYDLIQALLPLGYSASEIKKKYSIPFVLTVHGGDIYNLPFQNDWYMSLAICSEPS